MTDLIRDDLLQKLIRVAEHQNRDVNVVLADLLAPYQFADEAQDENATLEKDDIPSNSLAALARVAEEANLSGSERVTSENSREILQNEYADSIKARWKRDADDSPG